MPTITRRQFNAGSLAAALLPSLFVPRQKVRQIDLGLFCDRDDDIGRFDLEQPFKQEYLSYATDGRVCVRTPLEVRMPDGEPQERRLPKACGLTWDHDNLKGWRSLDRARFVDAEWPQECHVCTGRGCHGGSKCSKCDATGWQHFSTSDHFADYELPCDCKTGWVGGITCARCAGMGEIKSAVDLGGCLVAPLYWAKLRTLGEVEYCVTGGQEAVRFRAADVDGLLMPLGKQ